MYVQPVIEVVLDKPGTMRVAAVTATRVGSKLAILIDGQVSSAPVIMGPIALGNLTVAPDPVGTLEERVARTRALAIILASPLPATTVVRSRKVDAQSPPADDAVACEQGAADACDRACAAAPARCAAIAAPLVSGPTRRQNHSVALVLAERGCDGGDMAACGLAGAIHLEGMLPDHDLARAHVLLAKACAKGLALACTAKRSLVEQVRAVCDSDSDSAALYCDYLVQIDPAHAARTRKRQKVLEKKNGKWLDELEKQMKAQEKLEKEP